MRTYSTGLTTLLTGDQVLVDSLAMAIQLELVSGDVIRLAEVLEDTEIGAYVWSPAPGLKRGSIELPINEGPTNIDLEFQCDPDGPLVYADVQDGLLDAAILTVYAFDRDNLGDGLNVIFWGDVSDIRRGNFGFIELSAEGPTNRQTDFVNQTYQSPCRNRFTDERCGIDPDSVTFEGVIVSMTDRVVIVSGTGGQADEFFNVGLLRLTSGRLTNRAREIRLSTLSGGNQVLELYRHFGGVAPSPGDTCTVRRGCTHDFSATHGNRFYNNARRYNGEPRLEADDNDVVHVAAESEA